jgi:3-deoxy-D-arabino-heptulosonate 7-phosphate (DAHP) synthase
MARAAVAAGADGIMVEVHNHPESALSDGPQSIYPAQFATMMDEIGRIAPVVGRHLSRQVPVAAAAATK